MGRNTKGRVNRKKGALTAAEIKKGIDSNIKGKFSLRKAAKESKAPYPTPRRIRPKIYLKPFFTIGAALRYDVKNIFTEEQENSINDYIIECALSFMG